MNSFRFVLSIVVVACILSVHEVYADSVDEAKLKAEAKFSEADAQKIALLKRPNGKIINSELEEENGYLVWSFDISKPDTKNITEIQVDAKTGKIVSTQIETPADQSKEAAVDKATQK